jgi:hypothetical protein
MPRAASAQIFDVFRIEIIEPEDIVVDAKARTRVSTPTTAVGQSVMVN